MKRLARRLFVLSALLWIFTLFSAAAAPAYAEVTGNCDATFKGVDVKTRDSGKTGDAVEVDENEVVAVGFNSPAGFTEHKIQIQIAGITTTVSSEDDDGDTSFSDTYNVKDYAKYGTGYYKVIGKATLNDGSTCSGALLVKVTKNALETPAGIAATATTAVGGAMVLGSSASPMVQGRRTGRSIEEWITDEIEQQGQREERRAQEEDIRREQNAWLDTFELFFGPFFPWFFCPVLIMPALLLTGATMAMPGGGAPVPAGGLRLRRAPWRPRLSALGLVGGLLGGAGLVVMLQQFAVTPLTGSVAIEGIVAGLVVGLLLPTLAQTWTIMGLNAKIARGERRLSQAMGLTPQPQAPSEPPSPPPSQPQPPSDQPPSEPQG
jgi:hypothetical protein